MKPFDAVMFDLDGTLIETAPEIADAVNLTLREVGHNTVTQQQVNDWIGHGTLELLIQALAYTQQMSDQQVRNSQELPGISATFNKHYQHCCGTRSHLYPQVRETLTALRDRDVRLAVVTNKESRFTHTVLEAHSLTAMFDVVVSGDTLPVKKPNPAGIAHCLGLFKATPERSLFVGDSSIDIATARNAGVAVWALPYGYNMGQPIAACAPDRIIANCAALLD
jgi:phosphoglycolate phosphatase